MPQIDHRIGQRLERVVHLTDVFEAQQQTAKLILPGEDALNGPEALVEDGRVKAILAVPLRGFAPARIVCNIGHHAAVEDGLVVGPAVVDAVQADDRPPATPGRWRALWLS